MHEDSYPHGLVGLRPGPGRRRPDRRDARPAATPWPSSPTSASSSPRWTPMPPSSSPTLQRTQFEQTISQQLLFARLGEFFGLLAVLLVATGLYGTLAYRVNMRTAEIGVRMAVGARREQVVWMILKDSLLLTAAGAITGSPLGLPGWPSPDLIPLRRQTLRRHQLSRRPRRCHRNRLSRQRRPRRKSRKHSPLHSPPRRLNHHAPTSFRSLKATSYTLWFRLGL